MLPLSNKFDKMTSVLWGEPGELGECGGGGPVAPQPSGIQRESEDAVTQDTSVVQLRLHTSQHTAVGLHRRHVQSLWQRHENTKMN